LSRRLEKLASFFSCRIHESFVGLELGMVGLETGHFDDLNKQLSSQVFMQHSKRKARAIGKKRSLDIESVVGKTSNNDDVEVWIVEF